MPDWEPGARPWPRRCFWVARIVDAVDDPIQGFIMDSAKVGKHGKYKKFYLLSIIMTAVGTIALYSMPRAVAQIPRAGNCVGYLLLFCV